MRGVLLTQEGSNGSTFQDRNLIPPVGVFAESFRLRESAEFQPGFLTAIWKGGASAPPLQGLTYYSRVPWPAQLVAASCAGRGTHRGRAGLSAGLKPRPSTSTLKLSKCGEKSGLALHRKLPLSPGDFGPLEGCSSPHLCRAGLTKATG